MKWSKLYNPLMIGLLRSPLHGIASKYFILLTFTGRKSGKVYTTPVEYFYNGNTLHVFTQVQRVWWRNLQGGVPVTVRLRGQDYAAIAEAVGQDAATFEPAFHAYIERFPGRAKYFDIRQDADGTLNHDDIVKAAQGQVTISLHLQTEANRRAITG